MTGAGIVSVPIGEKNASATKVVAAPSALACVEIDSKRDSIKKTPIAGRA